MPQWETIPPKPSVERPSLPQQNRREPNQSPVVVLGKKSVRKDEIAALVEFGKALAKAGKQLLTTKTEGAPAHVAEGYSAAGGKPVYLQKDQKPDPESPIVIFTNSAMYAENGKTWEERGWLIINNPKETIDAARFARIILHEKGTPLTDGG